MIRFSKLLVFFTLSVQLLFEVDAKAPLTDEQIENGQWADTGIDQFFRVHTDTDGVLQFKAAGIRSNLPLFEGKTADLKELSLALKDKGNTFLKEYGVTGVELTPQSKNIVLDSDAFADGKKVQIDKSSSFFKIVFEGAGLMGTLLKTGEIEEPTYLESSEGKVTIHGPPIVTGATEAGVRAVTDITGTVVMVYDLAVDKEARKQAWEGLLGIKNQIAEDPSLLWPLLGEAILEEATQTTPEDWQIMNDPNTDPGKQKHLYSRGTVRTATSVFLSGKFIMKLPKIADDIILKMARAKGRIKIKSVAEATQELQDNLGALLEKIKALPEQGKKFLDDFADASDETIEAFLRNPSFVDSWKVLDDAGETFLKNDLTELELVSKNLNEIETAGGYTKWKNLAGKFTTRQIEDYVILATKQNDKSKIMLGMWDGGGSSSYISKAGSDYTYFDFGDKWNEAYNLVNKNDDEIWRINQKFIDNQKALGKEFWFSHDPFSPKNEQFFAREVNHLIDLGVKDFEKIGDLWKAVW